MCFFLFCRMDKYGNFSNDHNCWHLLNLSYPSVTSNLSFNNKYFYDAKRNMVWVSWCVKIMYLLPSVRRWVISYNISLWLSLKTAKGFSWYFTFSECLSSRLWHWWYQILIIFHYLCEWLSFRMCLTEIKWFIPCPSFRSWSISVKD